MPTGSSGSSLAARIADNYQRTYGRPADANDPQYAAYASAEMARLMKADADALARSQRNMNRIRNAAYVAAAVPFGAAALSAIPAAGAVAPTAAPTAGAGGAAPAFGFGAANTGVWTTGVGAAPVVAGAAPAFGIGAPNTGTWATGVGAAPPAIRNAAGGGNDGVGGNGLFRASDLVRYGIPAAASLFTGYMGNRATSNASTAALDAQQRQFDATQAWLREQEANNERRHKEIEDEKRRQFDAVETEKRRRWDYGEPWREASRGALTRMSDLMDRGPQQVAYRPTFQYRP